MKILSVLVHWCRVSCLLTVGTSNWSEDYFVSTAGVGLVINDTETGCQATDIINGVTSSPCRQTMQSQLAAVFDRDWNSVYAHPLPKWCLRHVFRMSHLQCGNCWGVWLTLPVRIFNPPHSLIYSFVLGARNKKKFESVNVHGAVYYLICCFYTHRTQSPTMSYPLHHILDSTCSSTILSKTFSASKDLNTSTSLTPLPRSSCRLIPTLVIC